MGWNEEKRIQPTKTFRSVHCSAKPCEKERAGKEEEVEDPIELIFCLEIVEIFFFPVPISLRLLVSITPTITGKVVENLLYPNAFAKIRAIEGKAVSLCDSPAGSEHSVASAILKVKGFFFFPWGIFFVPS